MAESKRVLLIGRNPTVLRELAQALQREGFGVDTTNNVEQAGADFDASVYALVAFGRGVDEPTNQRLRTDFTRQNKQIQFVNGLAPVIPLLVRQIKAALAPASTGEKAVAQIQRSASTSVDITLRIPCRLTVTLYQLDAVHTTDRISLIDEYVSAGEQQLRLPESRDAAMYRNFLVIETDKADFVAVSLEEG